MKKLLIVCALVAGPLAHAGFYSGKDLFGFMNSNYAQNHAHVIGYIAGVSDRNTGIDHCPPGKIKLGQVSEIVKAYLVANPELHHMNGDDLVSMAMTKAFPCPAK